MTPVLAFHIVGSLVVAIVGRNRRIGFIGFLIVSLLITPLAGLLVLWLTGPKQRRPA